MNDVSNLKTGGYGDWVGGQRTRQQGVNERIANVERKRREKNANIRANIAERGEFVICQKCRGNGCAADLGNEPVTEVWVKKIGSIRTPLPYSLGAKISSTIRVWIIWVWLRSSLA
jgi:hypothetical protein